jgi:hypothetical protein
MSLCVVWCMDYGGGAWCMVECIHPSDDRWWWCSGGTCRSSTRHSTGRSPHTPASGSGTRTVHYITVHYITLYSTLHCTVHYITVNYISALQCITMHSSAFQCITLHYITLQCSAVQCIALPGPRTWCRGAGRRWSAPSPARS